MKKISYQLSRNIQNKFNIYRANSWINKIFIVISKVSTIHYLKRVKKMINCQLKSKLCFMKSEDKTIDLDNRLQD